MSKDDNIIEAGEGSNSLNPTDLRNYLEEVEKLIADRQVINEDIKAILERAEHDGFDKKMLRQIIKIRAMDQEERREQEELRDAYLSALGLL